MRPLKPSAVGTVVGHCIETTLVINVISKIQTKDHLQRNVELPMMKLMPASAFLENAIDEKK